MDVRREKTDVRWVGFHPLVFVPGKPFRPSKGEAYLKELTTGEGAWPYP